MDHSPQSGVANSINPWVFHLRKLSLELSCPLCLNLFTRPVLLPCDHMFCGSCLLGSPQFHSKCSLCKKPYSDQDLRPGVYMENIVNIYKHLDMTLSSGKKGVLKEGSQKKSMDCENKSWKGHHVMSGEDSSTGRCRVLGDNLNLEFLGRREMENEFVKSQPHEHELKDSHGSKNEGSKKVFSRATLDNTCDKQDEKKGNDQSDSALEESRDSCSVRRKRLKKMDSKDLKFENSEAHCIEQIKETSESLAANKFTCAFCRSSKISEITTGPMLHYDVKGKTVEQDKAFLTKVKHVHMKCINWAPKVYFDGETAVNLEKEIARSAKLKCASCGLRGAALGCFNKSCPKSYHVPCAVEIDECRWDVSTFSMLCPAHISTKFPNEKFPKLSSKNYMELHKIASQQSAFWLPSYTGSKDWVLCGSALSSQEKFLLVDLGKQIGVTVKKLWSSDVTHIIASTDDGVCVRTFNVLMAIANGRWVITIDWVKACLDAKHSVDEEPYEIRVDNHGCCDGPKTGRLRALNNEPKLFKNFNFYIVGEFVAPSPSKRDLQELIAAAGGTETRTPEDLEKNDADFATTVLIYDSNSLHGNDLCKEVLMRLKTPNGPGSLQIGLKMVPHTWILDSIAASKLQRFVC